MRQAARVQEHAAAGAPRAAQRHHHPLQRGPHPPEAGHLHPQGREEQPPHRAQCRQGPRVGPQVSLSAVALWICNFKVAYNVK